MLYQSNQRRLRHTSPLIHFITLALLSPVMCRLPCRFSTVSQPLSSRALFHLSPCLCVLVCVCAQRSSCPQQMETFTELGWGGGGSGEYGHSPTYSNLRRAEMNVSKTRTQNESSTPQLDIRLIHRPPSLQSPRVPHVHPHAASPSLPLPSFTCFIGRLAADRTVKVDTRKGTQWPKWKMTRLASLRHTATSVSGWD